MYTLLDFGNGKRLERWGDYVLVRPDPTAVGVAREPMSWKSADAEYVGEKGKGKWVLREAPAAALLSEWPVAFGDIALLVRLSPYKHTGVFPEQAQNWLWARERARGRKCNILNLFAYTGGSTVALAKDGHFVTHVDASRPTVAWAKANAAHNRLPADTVRWIVDDVPTFVAREYKRGKRYDAIIVDPPAYGHAPAGGKAWRVERDLSVLLETCAKLLTDQPAFMILNGYAKHDSPASFHRLLNGIFHAKRPSLRCTIDAHELGLTAEDGRVLSTGSVARCAFGGKVR